MSKLPSKKVLSVFVIAAALVVSIIITFGKDKASGAINIANNLVAGEKIVVPENPNWKNELGVVSVLESTPTQAVQAEGTPQEETVTDLVSRNLVSNYLVLKQNGNFDQSTSQALVDQTSNYIENYANYTVKPSELKIIPDNGKQTMIEYGENLGMILKSNKTDSSKNELTILQSALSTRSSEKLGELQEAIDVYKKIANELVKMPVPQTFVKAHLDTVKGMRGLVSGLEQMKKVFSDPIVGLQGVQTFKTGGELFVQSAQASSKFLIQNNISYKQGSGGYYLLYGI